MADIDSVYEWLVDGAPGADGPSGVIQRVCDDLARAGIPIDRVVALVRTLHPQIMGRAFEWSRGGTVEVREASYDLMSRPGYTNSPVAVVADTGRTFRRRLDGPDAERSFPVLRELASGGFTDYVAIPVRFLSGEIHTITFATKGAGGFSGADIAVLERITRPLSRIAEVLALRRTASNLLSTYVGRNAGARILAGKIQRGDVDTVRAVIWFSDLRGFTALTESMEPKQLIEILNRVFDCQIGAIHNNGGEILKFMGDGLLAIFPLLETKPPNEVCDAAHDAAVEAFAALRAANQANADAPPMRIGLALHLGDVAYGNIGGANRLDFTCIGPAVNVASRLEGLTSRIGRPVVMSESFAQLTTRPCERIGVFELKGVAEPKPVWAPAAESPLAAW